MDRMNLPRDFHVNIRKIFYHQLLSFYDHLAFIAVEHNLFITEITQTAVVFYTNFLCTIYGTNKWLFFGEQEITTSYFLYPYEGMTKNRTVDLPQAKETPPGNIISYICDFSRGVLNTRSIRSYPTLAPRPQI